MELVPLLSMADLALALSWVCFPSLVSKSGLQFLHLSAQGLPSLFLASPLNSLTSDLAFTGFLVGSFTDRFSNSFVFDSIPSQQ